MKKHFLLVLTFLWALIPLPNAMVYAQTENSPAAESSQLKVQLKIGTGLQKLNLLGEGTTFPEDTPLIVAWSLVEGATQPTDIEHVWIYNGKEIARSPLLVKSTYYRTYTRRAPLGKVGSWTVQVKDSSGAILASQNFDVTAAKPAH